MFCSSLTGGGVQSCQRLGLALLLVGGVSSKAPAQAQTVAPPAKFTINAIDISGAKLLTQDRIEEIIYPYVGPNRTSQDVEAARKALQDAYAKLGYESVQVDIPPQPNATFAQGIVELKVTEVPVANVAVTGSKFHSRNVVRREISSVRPGKPLDLKALQAQLNAANRFPDREISPLFNPGKTPGTIDVELKVKDKLPLHASLEVNNDHSPSTVPLRVIASARYTDLFRLGQTITATYIVAPENRKQTEVFSGSYSAPILGSPWTLVLFGYKSNSNIAALGGSNVLGNGYQIGGRAMYQLPVSKTYQSVSFGLDYKNFKQNIFVAGKPAGQAPIEYVPLAANFSFSAPGEKNNLDLTLAATAGLRLFRRFRCFALDTSTTSSTCTPVDQFKNKDLDASENFFHLNLDANYTHSFAHDIVAAARLSAQLADSHLVTNEQFAAGGLTSVRGYLQSEAVGDTGIVSSLELRSPSIAPVLPRFVDELRLFAFADAAEVRILRTLPGQTDSYTLLGAGAGVRVSLFNVINSDLVVAVPIHNGPTSKAGDIRTMFSARGQF